VLPDAPDVRLANVQDVLDLLASTASGVRRGQIDTKVGSCLAYVASISLRALEAGELAERVAELEQRLEGMADGR
jgi:hypothetical protein